MQFAREIPKWGILLLIMAGLFLLPSGILAQPDSSGAEEPPLEVTAAGDSLTADAVLAIAPPAPVTNIIAEDAPNDPGKRISITWKISADDGAGAFSVTGYDVLRASSPADDFAIVGSVSAGSTSFSDGVAENGVEYFYIVRAKSIPDVFTDSVVAGPAMAAGQWFHTKKVATLLFTLLFCGLVSIFIQAAKGGAGLYVRAIAGINAVDEAIGRATEMGKPILFVPGLGTASDVATIAAFTILGRVAKKTAEYQSRIIVPNYEPVVMAVCQEVVKTAYLDAGRPDEYNEKDVYFVTQSQFAYVAAVNGVMLRDKPATNIYMGMFYAESLILAETGYVAGSIQIAGTDEIIQIPFFITTCDYTLIGEEMYAASAYLSQEPTQLGTLKAQDFAKAIAVGLLIIGIIAATFGFQGYVDFFDVG